MFANKDGFDKCVMRCMLWGTAFVICSDGLRTRRVVEGLGVMVWWQVGARESLILVVKDEYIVFTWEPKI